MKGRAAGLPAVLGMVAVACAAESFIPSPGDLAKPARACLAVDEADAAGDEPGRPRAVRKHDARLVRRDLVPAARSGRCVSGRRTARVPARQGPRVPGPRLEEDTMPDQCLQPLRGRVDWHGSDGLDGTGPGARNAHFGRLKCRWMSLGVVGCHLPPLHLVVGGFWLQGPAEAQSDSGSLELPRFGGHLNAWDLPARSWLILSDFFPEVLAKLGPEGGRATFGAGSTRRSESAAWGWFAPPQYLVGTQGPIPRAPGATQRRLTTPNATSGRHLAQFARPDCAIEPVRIVPRNPSRPLHVLHIHRHGTRRITWPALTRR